MYAEDAPRIEVDAEAEPADDDLVLSPVEAFDAFEFDPLDVLLAEALASDRPDRPPEVDWATALWHWAGFETDGTDLSLPPLTADGRPIVAEAVVDPPGGFDP